jgi:transposase
MSVLAYKEFIQRLKTKAIETTSNVLIVEESYTSNKCSSCLLVKDPSKKFTGKRCKCDVN